MKRQCIHMYTGGCFEPTARVTRMVNNGNVYIFQRRVNCKLEKLTKIQEACPTRISTWQFSFFFSTYPMLAFNNTTGISRPFPSADYLRDCSPASQIFENYWRNDKVARTRTSNLCRLFEKVYYSVSNIVFIQWLTEVYRY